jgi:hypothetical protein
MKNNSVTGVRIPDELRKQWLMVCEKTNKDSADIIREMIKAAIRYYDRNGNLYPPFELVPGSRTPEEKITYTVTSPHGVAINGDNNGTIHIKKGRGK